MNRSKCFVNVCVVGMAKILAEGPIIFENKSDWQET